MTDEHRVGGIRTFSLNSEEAYEILCPRDDEHRRDAGGMPRSAVGIPNGALPREPRVWDAPVIVEPKRR